MKHLSEFFSALVVLICIIPFYSCSTTKTAKSPPEVKPEYTWEIEDWEPREEGLVPNEETAITIAVAVWGPIYGKEHIQQKAPYRAVLKDGVWYVTGSLRFGWKGGVPEAEISKKDGRILRVEHGM